MWEKSFIAASVLVGASVDDATASLPADAVARAADLLEKLRDSRRTVRAQALAVVGQEIARSISEVTLR